MKTICLLFFNILVMFCYSQNLVNNPSFENSKYVSEHLGNFNNNISNWSTPNTGSTDVFHIESEAVGTINFFGNQKPKQGNTYAGMYVLAPENYREYIQGELSKILTENESYTISFYISLAENSSHAIKNLGVLFLENSLNINQDKVLDINTILNQIEKSHITLINSQQFYIEKEAWEKVTFSFKAKGFEQVFVIGNFDTNKTTTTLKVQESKHPDASYYYIDHVVIEAVKEENLESNSIKNIEENSIETHTVYTLKNVLFEFNRHNLLKSSTKELDQLYNYLNQNKRLQIEVYGHTDTVGSQERNDELSLLRAKEVALYLISKGLKPERITATGFGDKFPVAPNTTETNRALNRRVEFKLIEN